MTLDRYGRENGIKSSKCNVAMNAWLQQANYILFSMGAIVYVTHCGALEISISSLEMFFVQP